MKMDENGRKCTVNATSTVYNDEMWTIGSSHVSVHLLKILMVSSAWRLRASHVKVVDRGEVLPDLQLFTVSIYWAVEPASITSISISIASM